MRGAKLPGLAITGISIILGQNVNTKNAPSPKPSATPRIVMDEMFVPTKEPGLRLYVRNKHPDDMNTFAPERTVLFVHGATYPSETTFDFSLDGLSWMGLYRAAWL